MVGNACINCENRREEKERERGRREREGERERERERGRMLRNGQVNIKCYVHEMN